jgi:uracil permease
MPADTPPWGAMLSLGFQQVLTMFPATVLVAILTKFDVGVTLLASGIGTIIALLVSKRKIPMYYGSSFSYIAVVVTAMSLYAGDCFSDPTTVYCPEGVRLVQVGIIGTGVVNILAGLLIMRLGKAALDRVLPPIVTGSVAIIIGVALSGAALGMAGPIGQLPSSPWLPPSCFRSTCAEKACSGMLPILFGAIVGYGLSAALGIVDYSTITNAEWVRVPAITFPLSRPRAWGLVVSIALIAIATIPESTAHLYQMSLYIDDLAQKLGKKPHEIKQLIGLNLVADGADDVVVGFLGGAAGTNYGENNSLMAITRNYSVPVLFTAGAIAILLGFIGKLAGLVNSIPIAVTGGLAIYLFGIIGMQGIALIQSEKVNLFDPKNLAIGSIILVFGIGGNLALPAGLFPFQIPVFFPEGIPAIVFAAMAGILTNLVFVIFKPAE